jgi:hypothetical protein
VEVFNKTVKKYLASYVDETTLNWDEFLPALMLAVIWCTPMITIASSTGNSTTPLW